MSLQAKLIDWMSALLNGWENDLSSPWRVVIGSAGPDPSAIAAELTIEPDETIFPGRKGRPPAGARSDAHIFRAFDDLAPQDVRVLVIGQDPYPDVRRATGRAFEQGDLEAWTSPRVTPTLKRIVQSLLCHRTKDSSYSNPKAWPKVISDVVTRRMLLTPPQTLWDDWQSQGVMFINSILTFTRRDPAHQFLGHAPVWGPFITAVLDTLAHSNDQFVVFVAWGEKAKQRLKAAGLYSDASRGRLFEIVDGPHPKAPPFDNPPFLANPSSFGLVNQCLRDAGCPPIKW